MAALSEKVLWPIVAIIIFGVLAFFYIDDRRSLAEHGGQAAENKQTSKEHGGKAAKSKQSSKEHDGQAAENKSAEKARTKARALASSSNGAASASSSDATSMSMDEYLSASAGERSTELEANVAHHQGFSGGIDDYLSGKTSATKNTQASSKGHDKKHGKEHSKEHGGKAAEKSPANASSSEQALEATSMTMDEYQARANGAQASDDSNATTQQATSNSGAYHGDMEGYLAKFGDGKQTRLNDSSEKPFDQKEHMGFHGSYEDYAKKYN